MILDERRNRAYQEALAALIKPDSVVMDLGAGSGILGLIAARLGAARVYLVEPSTPLETAMELARRNGLQDRVVPVPQTVEQADLPGKVDVIISVFTGNFLLEEDLLPSLVYARDHCLAPHGRLVPSKARMWIQPVSIPNYYAQQIDRWSLPVNDLDFSPMAQFAGNHIYYDAFEMTRMLCLADPVQLAAFDLETVTGVHCDEIAHFRIEQPGMLQGYLGWFDMQLGDQWFSTGPEAPRTHWQQAFLPVKPVALSQGETLSVRVHRPEHGVWSWQSMAGGIRSSYSTLNESPVTPARLSRLAADARPRCGSLGHTLSVLLQQMDGTRTTGELAAWLHEYDPVNFSSPAAARIYIQKQIDWCCRD